jgi:hypothetical protein
MSLEIVVTKIQLRLARPEEADMRKIQHYAAESGAALAEAEPASALVKLYLQTPLPTDGMGIELYVNDQLIRRYSTFKNGIYFKVNDPQKLSNLRGGEVRFHRPGTDEFLDTGVTIPDAEDTEDPAALRAGGAVELPSQEEVLRD